MTDASDKNFKIIQGILNEQAETIRNLTQKLTALEGNVAQLHAEIIATKQMNAHLAGRGMGATVKM